MSVSGGCVPWRGVKGQRTCTLKPEWFAIHWESEHLQRRLERSIGCLSLLANDAIVRRDALASCCNIPISSSCATPSCLINDLQIEDDPTSLDLPGFDSTVEDADSLRERRDVQAGGEAT